MPELLNSKLFVSPGSIVIFRSVGGEEMIGKVQNGSIADTEQHISLLSDRLVVSDLRSFISTEDNRLGLVFSMLSVRTELVVINANSILMMVHGDEIPEALKQAYIGEISGLSLPPTKEILV